jgi:hypothetical protein
VGLREGIRPKEITFTTLMTQLCSQFNFQEDRHSEGYFEVIFDSRLVSKACGLIHNIETNLEIGEEGVYCVNIVISSGLFSDRIPCSMEVCYANMIRLSQNNKPLTQVLFTAGCASQRSPALPWKQDTN